MVAHRLSNPGPRSGSADQTSRVAPPRPRSPWVGHIGVCALGALGVLYLMLVWRAASLDAQVAVVEERLAGVAFEHLRAKRELAEVLPQAAPIGDIVISPTSSTPPPTDDTVSCPALPPVQSSALGALAGSTTPEGAPASPDPPAAPPRAKVAQTADLP